MTDKPHTPTPEIVERLTAILDQHLIPAASRELTTLARDRIVSLSASHAELVAALRECRNAMYADNPADGWKDIIDRADAALAKQEQGNGG
jgi:hypothetical protein